MRFALLLPLLPVLSLALAAPVPKSEPKPIASYSADELAKLPFVDADEIPKEWLGRGEGPKSGIVALAVTLPKLNYEIGEPVVPLFALKNRTDRGIGLGLRLDFTGEDLECCNSAAVEIRDAGTGKVVGPYLIQNRLQRTHDGERVPAHGYYVAGGNIVRGREGKPLPAGEYELSWRYGWAKSNAVKFRVLDRAYRGPVPYKSVRLLHVTEHGGELQKKALVEKELGLADQWDSPGVHPVEPGTAALALGTGRAGRYFPSLRNLPETTDKLKADVRWTREDGADSFTVTLAVRHKDLAAEVPGSPNVYLLIECDDTDSERQARDQLAELVRADRRVVADSPYELTVKLPNDWTDSAGATGPARVAVLVSTKELHDDWGDRKEQLKEADDSPDWVIRTPWRDITLPKPVEKLRKRDE